MSDLFERTKMLIGEGSLKKLSESKILVLGIGGVGSYVVEGLVRAGVGHLVLCDHDRIDVTNINRQIHATITTVGDIKAEAMKERVKVINPNVKVTLHPYLYNADSSKAILEPDLDYVVDAIDMVTSKLYLAQRCQELGLPLIASMGTGNKMNPTMLEVADIYETKVCPLAKVMRRELRKRDIDRLKVVYSRETPIKPIQKDLEVTTGQFVRRGIPGSISFVPSVAGLIIASEVIKDIISDTVGN